MQRPSASQTETLNISSGLTAFAGMLGRHHRLFLAGLCVGLAVASVYVYLAVPTYESLTRILVIKKTPTLPAHGTDSQSHLDQPVDDDLLATHMLILKSPQVIQKAVDDLGPKPMATINRALETDQDAAEYLVENLRVTRGGEGQERPAHVITLQLRHTSPIDCQVILEAIVASYNNFLRTTLLTPVDEALTLISQARDEIASDLQEIRAKYSKFRQHAPLLFNRDGSLNLHQARLAKLETALADIQVSKINTESRIRLVRDLRSRSNQTSTPLLHVAWNAKFNSSAGQLHGQLPLSATSQGGSPELGETAKTEFNQLLQLYLQKSELLACYGVDHPEVVQVSSSIRQVEAFLADKKAALETAWFDGLRADWMDLRYREQQLARMLESERQATKLIIQAELEDEALRSELDRHQRLFDAVLGRLASIHLAKDYGGFATEVIAPAKVGDKLRPRNGLIIGLGTVVGIILGVAACTLADQMQPYGRGLPTGTS